MKQCPKCGSFKPLTEFWKSSKQKDGFQTYCKACSSDRRVRYFRENKKRETELRNQQSAAYKDWYLDLKRGPCTDCGGTFHPVAMQWHHKPGEVKLFNLGHMASKRMARTKVLEEIKKCVLLCANCHAVRHYS